MENKDISACLVLLLAICILFIIPNTKYQYVTVYETVHVRHNLPNANVDLIMGIIIFSCVYLCYFMTNKNQSSQANRLLRDDNQLFTNIRSLYNNLLQSF